MFFGPINNIKKLLAMALSVAITEVWWITDKKISGKINQWLKNEEVKQK